MFTRYAIYVVPDGAWGDFGASWLGWDNRSGTDRPHADASQRELTERPRKYGFHGTIKPPFRLRDGVTVRELSDAAAALCAGFTPFDLASLQLEQIGRFYALTAPADHAALRGVADTMVTELDRFRAPLNAAELARRRASHLTDLQETLLQAWGYPHVLEEFKFHLTLTGRIKDPDAAQEQIAQAIAPMLRTPLRIDSLCLLGEADTGHFHVIDRFAFGS